ncbi:MAG: hypothetical protein ABL916_02480 [Burkholderiaceae bacterium]
MNAAAAWLAGSLLAASAFGSAAQTAATGASPTPAASAPDASIRNDVPLRSWSLRLPSVDKVVYRGGVSHDAAGMGTGAMLYVVPGPVGFLAAVLAHGLVTNAARQKQKDELQLAADRVLEPFAPVLDGFTHQQLMQAGLQRMSVGGSKRLLTVTEPAGTDWLIESAPVFSMTQDQSALVLDNALRIFAPGASTVTYAQTVRVVSAPLIVAAAAPPSPGPSASGVVPLWLESQGRRLTDESAALFAESMDIALTDASARVGDENAAHKTFRYPEGGSERMERAQPLAERCGRTLIRTLRGWLMSIPVGLSAGSGQCPAAAPAS